MAHTTGTQLTPKRAMEMFAEARERIETIGRVVDLRESEERVAGPTSPFRRRMLRR